MIAVYANPFTSAEKKTKLDYMALNYTTPFFHQNWNLFAPPPHKNYKLFAWFINKKQVVQTELFCNLVQQHQANRVAGYEPFLITFANSIHYFETNTTLQHKINGPVSNDINFIILERAAKNYLQHTYQTHIKDLKLVLFTQDVLTSEQQVYFN